MLVSSRRAKQRDLQALTHTAAVSPTVKCEFYQAASFMYLHIPPRRIRQLMAAAVTQDRFDSSITNYT